MKSMMFVFVASAGLVVEPAWSDESSQWKYVTNSIPDYSSLINEISILNFRTIF